MGLIKLDLFYKLRKKADNKARVFKKPNSRRPIEHKKYKIVSLFLKMKGQLFVQFLTRYSKAKNNIWLIFTPPTP